MTVKQYISLMDTMARLSLKAEAQRYYLGYLWWVLEPLLWVGVFYVVFYELLGTRTPDFLMFLAVGKLMFIWFSKTVNYAGNSLMSNQGLIGRMDLPKSLFPMTVILECAYRQIAVFLLLFVLILADGVAPSWLWFWLLPLALVQLALIIFAGCVASVLVAFQRDFALLINLGTVFMMFVSGVFWDINDIVNESVAQALLTWNPIAFLLHSYRQVMLWGQAPDVAHLLVLGLLTFVAMAATLYLMGRYGPHLARRVVSA